MCNWDGGIDYFLDPDDYTKKADGTNSDAANIDYAGDGDGNRQENLQEGI